MVCEWPGCVRRGQHRPECDAVECEGCVSRPAEWGRLCMKHWSWLNRDLASCAELVLQVRTVVVPGPVGDDSRVSGGKQTPPAPADVSAIDAADEVFALLVGAGSAMAEALHRPAPPAPAGVWRSGAVVHGLPACLSPEAASAVVDRVVAWWRSHLEELAGQVDIVDVGPELHELVGRVRRRWPEAERARHLPGTPCRECDLLDMWWTPPPQVGWPVTVECHSCGYVAPESDLHRLTRLVEFEHQSRKKAKRSKKKAAR